MTNQELIDQFYKESKSTKKLKLNGIVCHIGNKKNCKYYKIIDDKEICDKGWCYTK